jgi:hypothetical protein
MSLPMNFEMAALHLCLVTLTNASGLKSVNRWTVYGWLYTCNFFIAQGKTVAIYVNGFSRTFSNNDLKKMHIWINMLSARGENCFTVLMLHHDYVLKKFLSGLWSRMWYLTMIGKIAFIQFMLMAKCFVIKPSLKWGSKRLERKPFKHFLAH